MNRIKLQPIWQRLTKLKSAFALLLIFSLSYLFFHSTFFYESGKFMMDGKLHSDFAVHIPLIRSFSQSWNMPPEYPFFAGEPIRYHFLFYLVVGLLERIGLNLPLALNLLSALGMTLLLMMIYQYGKLFFNSSKAGLLAIYLFLLNGSLTFIDFFAEHGYQLSTLSQIVSAKDFTNFGPWNGDMISAFWNLNIYTNQRHLALSFGLVLLLLWPLIAGTIRQQFSARWSLPILAGFILMPFLHQAGAMILLLVVVGWIIWYWRNIDRAFALWYLGCVGLLLSSLWLLTPAASQPIEQVVGYLTQEKSVWGATYYWLQNIGLYVVFLPLLLSWSRKKMGIFLFLAYGLFFAANTFLLSTDLINNHKLINFFMIGMNLAMAGYIVELWQHLPKWRVLLVVLVMLVSTSGIIDLFPIINDTGGGVVDWSTQEIGEWILQHTDQDSHFLTGSYMYNPASIAGRIIFLDYGYHAWSMGYNTGAKRAALTQFFSPTINRSDWCKQAAKYEITHVLIGPNETSLEDGRILILESALVRQFPFAHTTADGWRVWIVKDLCQEN